MTEHETGIEWLKEMSLIPREKCCAKHKKRWFISKQEEVWAIFGVINQENMTIVLQPRIIHGRYYFYCLTYFEVILLLCMYHYLT